MEVLDLDEERGRKLSGRGNQGVVGVQLVLDLVRLDDPLGADHLLDLEPDSVAVLEQEGEVLTDRNATRALGFDDPWPDLVADLLVLDQVLDVVVRDRLHQLSSSMP